MVFERQEKILVFKIQDVSELNDIHLIVDIKMKVKSIQNVIIDVSDLDTVYKLNIMALIDVQRLICKSNGKLVIVDHNSKLDELFTRMHLVDYLKVAKSKNEAMVFIEREDHASLF